MLDTGRKVGMKLYAVFLWTPIHGHTSFSRPEKTYIHQLCADSGCGLDDMPKLMVDRDS